MSNALATLNDKQLAKIAPAVFARKGAKHMSDRYVPLPTIDVINTLRADGYVVTGVKQDRVTRRDPKFCRHMVRLTHSSHLKPRKIGEAVPNVIIIGSANGTKPHETRAGLYRLVCMNGMVIGSDFGRFRIKHQFTTLKEVKAQVKTLGKLAVKTLAIVDSWSKVKLNDRAQLAFARAAAELRFGDKAKQYAPADLLAVRRTEDEGNDLWHVFNRVQENAIRGGSVGRNANGRAVRARSLTGITNDISFNESLWALAEKAAKK